METTQKLAQHYLSTLKNVDNVDLSVTELSSFNMFFGFVLCWFAIVNLKIFCTIVLNVFFFGAFSVAPTHCERPLG